MRAVTRCNRPLMSLEEGRVRYVRHSVNQGACAARNMGMSLSSGRYVDFLDDDDEWLPENWKSSF